MAGHSFSWSTLPSVSRAESHSKDGIRIVLLGDEGVGKTALLVRYLTQRFLGEYDPTIEDSYSKVVLVDGKPITVDILDTAEQGVQTAKRRDYMESCNAFVIVYSTTSQDSFKSIAKYKALIDKYSLNTHISVALVGTKDDVKARREVSSLQSLELATKNRWMFAECSALQNDGVASVFDDLIRNWRIRFTKKRHSHVIIRPHNNVNKFGQRSVLGKIGSCISSAFNTKRNQSEQKNGAQRTRRGSVSVWPASNRLSGIFQFEKESRKRSQSQCI